MNPAVRSLTAVDWPALAVGAIVAVYWWRVLRMAMKMRRKTGQAANFVPTEPLGKFLRIVWQPVVWIWIVHPFVTAFLNNPPLPLRPLYFLPSVQLLAVIIALLAFIATRICWKRMGKSWRMGINPDERTMLIVTGPYAYVRHPIYALSSVLMLATIAAVPTPLFIGTAMLHLLLLQWEAHREERHLSTIHGQQYDLYCKSVGRFLPRTRRGYSTSAA
jgi:protein-S-isoprenylcysteine O-methyltransferase Ste14